MPDLHPESRASRLNALVRRLLVDAPELEAAAVVSLDGLPMASALPGGMDEDRVAAMSAVLLQLGDRAARGMGRGALSQVCVEGDDGAVFLVCAQDRAVLVAVGSRGAKVGMVLYELRRAATAVAEVLDDASPAAQVPLEALPVLAPPAAPLPSAPLLEPLLSVVPAPGAATWSPSYTPAPDPSAWPGADDDVRVAVLPAEPAPWT